MGFSPCGVAFAAWNATYSAPCRFFADDAGRSNRINWYRVPDDSLRYDKPHVFWPRIMDSDAPFNQLSEPTAKRTKLRKYNSGKNRWGTTGDHVDGDEQDFMGESLHTKYMVDGNPPTHPCGLTTADLEGLRIGSRSVDPHAPPFTRKHGLKLGTLALDPYAPPFKRKHGLKLGSKSRPGIADLHGLKLGSLGVDPHAPPHADLHGLQLGSLSVNPLAVPHELHGLELGTQSGEPPPPFPVTDLHGLELGDVSTDPTWPPHQEAHGIEFGSISADAPPVPAVDLHGIELGSISTAAPPVPAVDLHGIEFGNLPTFQVVPITAGADAGTVTSLTLPSVTANAGLIVVSVGLWAGTQSGIAPTVTWGGTTLSSAGMPNLPGGTILTFPNAGFWTFSAEVVMGTHDLVITLNPGDSSAILTQMLNVLGGAANVIETYTAGGNTGSPTGNSGGGFPDDPQVLLAFFLIGNPGGALTWDAPFTNDGIDATATVGPDFIALTEAHIGLRGSGSFGAPTMNTLTPSGFIAAGVLLAQ